MSRLTSLSNDLSGTTYDQTLGFGYNPASEIIQNARPNDTYAWTGHGNGSTNSTVNGLNQLSAIGSTVPAFDSKGNMTFAGGTTYTYSSENLLTSSSGGAALTYDPAMRLYQLSGGVAGTQRFGYDGTDLIAEYNSSNTLLRRYVFGPGTDEPIVWYEGTGTTDRRFLHQDERGSVVAVTNSSGTEMDVNTYDEYGKPATADSGRFLYTGQAYLPEVGLYDYKARMYASGLGVFMQTDPIGYGDGLNLYTYVHADPLNLTDPTGLCSIDGSPSYPGEDCTPIIVTGKRKKQVNGNPPPMGGGEQGGGTGGGEIVVRGRPCEPNNGTWLGAVRTVLDTVSTGADVVATGSVVAAVVTSETGVGGITFAGLAAASKLVSVGAAGLSGAIAWYQGDRAGAVSSAGDAITTALLTGVANRAIKASGKALKYGEIGATAYGTVIGKGVAHAICTGH